VIHEASGGLTYRPARDGDLPALIAMLADDPLGAKRERIEDPPATAYREAFAAIDADPAQTLLVCERSGEPIGVLQLTCTPGLSHQGAWRATIEGVRVARRARGAGVGEGLVREAIRRAAERGCRIVQLTTDRTRERAHAFYERLGFEATHTGMKLRLP
jgi:GNAT superfamily N-acetyltransferase